MIYNNQNVRRQDRLLAEEEAAELLRNGEYGVLSMTDCTGAEAAGYGVPLSFVWDGRDAVYIHCAKAGRKLLCIAKNPKVSFCVVGKTRVVPKHFTTAYQSIVLDCMAETGLSEDERRKAIGMIVDKYASDFAEIGRKYAEHSFSRTEIIKLTVAEWSGKSKRMA